MRFVFVFLLLFPLSIGAQLQLSKIFSDNMVLQRDRPIHIWGKAVPARIVVVSLGKLTKSAKSNEDSTWSIYLNAQKANTAPQKLNVISGDEKILLKNVLIGDVWLCIGQSNMEFPMMREMHFKDEIVNSNQSLLRFYNPTYAGKNIFGTLFNDSVVKRLNKQRFYEGQWEQSDSNTFKQMSAVAYYFGKEIISKTKSPIGIINLSIGGAPLETFIDKEVLKKSNRFSSKVNGDWLNNDALPIWIKERGLQNTGKIQNAPDDENGNNHGYKPGFAYVCGIEQIISMPIKGVLCYQGESNAQEIERVNEYGDLSKLLVDDYRKKWKQPEMPFYYVQLSSIDTLKYRGQLWPEFRNEQREMLELISNSGMAVCSDIGFKDDVHPTNKRDVGERLARWALSKTYKQNIVPSGPLPRSAKYENEKVVISFQYMARGLKTSDNSGKLKGFSLDGKNEVDAILGDSGVLIFTKSKPTYVYYGWKPFSDGNLVNSEDLPASTFKIRVQ